MNSPVVVTSLHTYPVKSCGGLSLTESPVTRRGLLLDRDFMVIDDHDDFVSQRSAPELALVAPRLEASLILTAPGMEPVRIPLETEREERHRVVATVHGRPVTGQLVGEEVSDWLTTYLPPGRGTSRYRLLRACDDAPDFISERYQRDGASNQVSFADAYAILLATEPSLAALNATLEQPVPMNRFRPNIVVDGDGLHPYDEDCWSEITIGSLSAFVVKPCDRCSIPDVDQQTAVVGKAVRRALVARKGSNAHDSSNTGVFFAQNLNHVHVPGTVIAVGDRVEVLTRSATPNVVLAAAARASH